VNMRANALVERWNTKASCGSEMTGAEVWWTRSNRATA
jgi:hypothetical protein